MATKTKETPKVQQIPVDAAKLVQQLKNLDPNMVRSALKEAGITKGAVRTHALAQLYGWDQGILANIAKLLASQYNVSEGRAEILPLTFPPLPPQMGKIADRLNFGGNRGLA